MGVPEPQLFSMVREADESGVSGTGRVLDGVRFHNSMVAVCWRTDVDASKHGHTSMGYYPTWEAFEFIHITSHPGNQTKVVWHDRNLTKEQAKDVYAEGVQTGMELGKKIGGSE